MRHHALLLVLSAGCAPVYTDITRIDDAPVASILSPSEGAVVPSGRLELLGRVTDAVDPSERLYATWSLQTEAGFVDVCRGFADADGTTSCVTEVGPDVTGVRLQAQDVPGFRGSERLPLVVRPTYAPEVLLLAPEANTRLYANVGIAVEAEVVDADHPPGDLVLRWETDVIGVIDGPTTVDASGRVSGVLSLPAGEHRLRLLATDPDGSTGSDELRVGVRGPNLAPTVRVISPERGAVFAEGALVEVDAAVSDAETPPDALVVDVASDRDGAFVGVQRGENGAAWAGRADLRVGTHVLTVRAVDDAGTEGSDALTVIVDRPPTLVLTAPAADAQVELGEAFEVRGVVTDENPGTEQVEVTVDTPGATVARVPTEPGVIHLRVWLPAGPHLLSVRATDGLGLATVVARPVTVTAGGG